MVWDKIDRRKQVRREADRAVCPYHDLKFNQVCGNITNNNKDIEEVKKNMVTKDDLKDIKDAVKAKAPRWVLVTFIVTAVPIFLAVMGWIGTRLDTVTKIEANQKILMDALSIDIHTKDYDQQDQ
jgi:hypothetical protein